MLLMKEIRIEVTSERDAIEYCRDAGLKFVKVYEGRGNNYGRLMMLAIDESDIQEQQSLFNDPIVYKEEVKNCIIYTTIGNGSTMYIGVKGCPNKVTFNESMAQRFTEKEARSKAWNMSKHKRYNWMVKKLGGH